MTLNIPCAVSSVFLGTRALAINSANTLTGYYLDNSGVCHGFLLTKGGVLTTFEMGTQVTPSSIDMGGTVTGYYQDANGGVHRFLRATNGTITSFDVSGANGTYPESIKGHGVAPGYYYDAEYAAHGFILTP